MNIKKYHNLEKEIKDYLLGRYDYISKWDAIQELKPMYNYLDGWLPIAIKVYNSINIYNY